MRKTNIFEKLSASIINISVVSIASLPFYGMYGYGLIYKLIVLIIFFVYSLLFMFIKKGRDVGMIAVGSYWQERYSVSQRIIYIILYTLSFSTILFWLLFPLDLLIVNLCFLQLPVVLLKGTTLHGYLSGNMTTAKKH